MYCSIKDSKLEKKSVIFLFFFPLFYIQNENKN